MLLHPPSKSVLLKVPDPFMIRDLLRQSKVLFHADYNIAVKHTMEATKVLRNIGFQVPSPIISQYNWPGKYVPFDHQKVMADFYTVHRRCFNLSEMGTGKTAATLWAADFLMKTKRVRKALILSPLSTMERVWQSDTFDILMHRVCILLHGTREQRMHNLSLNADFYVLNHDGVKIPEVMEALRKRPDIDLVIVDEGSMFRNASTGKYKALAKMLREDQRLWWITGTPCPNAPTDAWAQAKLVAPQRVPKFFGSFKRMTMAQMSQFKWVPRPDAYKLAYEAMQPAVRFKKEDCLDLPPVTFTSRQAELSAEQRKAFNQMRQAMQAEAKSTKITAVNAADKLGKLRQILCGVIKDPITEKYIEYDYDPRATVLKEAIESAEGKVYVVVPFKGIVQSLAKKVSEYTTCAILNGDVPMGRRNQIIKDFKEQVDPHTLLCHPKVMAHGLNLTEASVLVFYAPIFSNDEYRQVIERMNRAGQTRKMTIVRIGAHPLEWEIYRIIDGLQITQDNILDLYKSVTE